MTRILEKTVICPHCGHAQKASVAYSWNEQLSGPMPANAFATACTACRREFDPLQAESAAEDAIAKNSTWRRLWGRWRRR